MRLVAAAIFAAVLASGSSSGPGFATSSSGVSGGGSPPPAGALEFVALGDWGRRGGRLQREVAGAMSAWTAAHPARFVLALGDNFYEFGVSSVTDSHWTSSFEDVYTSKGLQVPWWVALGNHDYRGNVEAQIAYARGSSRWRMPARAYTFVEPVGGGARAQFFVIDTTPFLARYRSFLSITAVAGQDTARQVAWLEQELAASTAEWKIVVGHHPILSCGPHGDSKELVRDILPLLERHRASVYLNGHEHGLQHLRSGGIDFLTSGGGSEATRVSRDARTVWAEATAGFLSLTVAPEFVRVAAVDADGRVRHDETLARPPASP